VLRRSSTGRLEGGAAGDGGATPELPSWTGAASRERREKRDSEIDGSREPGRDKVGFFCFAPSFSNIFILVPRTFT
jgi:hypothetical protein